MYKKLCCTILFSAGVVFFNQGLIKAQNPIVRNQFTADPTARVFNGKVYVFPSHDILAVEGKGRPGWFCMADYHVFSSNNLTHWNDHGVILSQNKVQWVDSTSYSMWAPDCVERNGKYYFYFPANSQGLDDKGMKRFAIGVAIADKPEGPYVPQPNPIVNVAGIDPNVFIDKDGQAYLYWAQRYIYMAKLSDNMLELASEPQVIKNLPDSGLIEGPFMFERSGVYYLTYPHVQNKIERLEYAIADNPMGPFRFGGVMMDESPMNCWTNHQSVIEYNKQWYLFYHQNALSPKFDKSRSICIDSLFFNGDGTILKVTPTLRGVGLTKATDKIEIDRYSSISNEGVEIAFVDTTNTFNGWKCMMNKKGAWIQYNNVDFEVGQIQHVEVRMKGKKGGCIQLHIGDKNGPVIATVKISDCDKWVDINCDVKNVKHGVNNIAVSLCSDEPLEIDWLKFK